MESWAFWQRGVGKEALQPEMRFGKLGVCRRQGVFLLSIDVAAKLCRRARERINRVEQLNRLRLAAIRIHCDDLLRQQLNLGYEEVKRHTVFAGRQRLAQEGQVVDVEVPDNEYDVARDLCDAVIRPAGNALRRGVLGRLLGKKTTTGKEEGEKG